ncbi:cytochrome P450 [Arthrobacter sp. Br18]|uniref:cytochrome P450 n=1 Tax=Arthrobacter sp. Br18 TaxID=1312954 RepID=UPI0004790A87|nr:cytochrome P450 [Arthrobacter sp. Br18]
MGISRLPKASLLDTALFAGAVFLPTFAKGPIIRRPRVVALVERFRLDDRAVDAVCRIHSRNPEGPLLLRLPLRHQALILAPGHVDTVLNMSPDPFSPASAEKRAALTHFQPNNVLISTGPIRSVRRALQEQVLDTDHPIHLLADAFLPVVREEMDELLATAAERGELIWKDFLAAWYRVVRRVVFGDHARDDSELTDMIVQLRRNGNWAFLRPQQKKLRAKFLARITEELARAEEGSLASVMAARAPRFEGAAPAEQVPQWLFAFDPAGMATFRALAVLATHPEARSRARQELHDDGSSRSFLPYLRSCVLEALRLWPTTPLILRQTTRPVEWEDGMMPAKCGVLIFAPYFHRDERNLPRAHQFAPERWLDDDGGDSDGWPLVPFSDGPVVCPGKQLVLLLTSAALAQLIDRTDLHLTSRHRLDPQGRLPGTLDNYSLRFAPSPRGEG